MKFLWLNNNKDKLVLSEEGNVDENLERIQKKNKCKIVMTILKIIIVLEIIMLIGSALILFYKYQYCETTVEKTQSEPHSTNELLNLKLSSENSNDYNIKTVNNENNENQVQEDEKVKQKNEMINNEEKIFEEKNSNDEISSNEMPFKKLFSLLFSLPQNEEIDENQNNKNPQTVLEEPMKETFHIRMIFHPKNPNKNSNQTNENIINPIITLPENIIENEESLNQNINNDDKDDFYNILTNVIKSNVFSNFFNFDNKENYNAFEEIEKPNPPENSFSKLLENNGFKEIISSNTLDEADPLLLKNIWDNLNQEPIV
ncbi:dual specificity mitogen-activated protein kinase kinase 1-like [Leptopilina boulardi]|uniref:dual specificity mitogen-activated protein kinase kinase 1-like n=1 Tax=Leptopilina boulardi TaxID=63433 RepID=UPI0021F5F281|nr:dual specificity mitogen-activated protein kinase kinase 1-like [Leptopilina boulardi]